MYITQACVLYVLHILYYILYYNNNIIIYNNIILLYYILYITQVCVIYTYIKHSIYTYITQAFIFDIFIYSVIYHEIM